MVNTQVTNNLHLIGKGDSGSSLAQAQGVFSENTNPTKLPLPFVDRGSVLKISQVAGSRQPCLLTEIDLFPVSIVAMIIS